MASFQKIGLTLQSLFLFGVVFAQKEMPNTEYGRIERLENVQSAYITSRHVDVWLPENYSDKSGFNVLYMHDGQLLYDTATTWNHKSWEVDSIANSLISQGKVAPFIVVGIHNGNKTRYTDYFPQKPYESMNRRRHQRVERELQFFGKIDSAFSPGSDAYLKFLMEELKPMIDSMYATKPEREYTYMAGSSMGGLISWYGLCEYPERFKGVACLSSHWPGTMTLKRNPVPGAFLRYLNAQLPDTAYDTKIYFDCGDQTLDALYPIIQQRVDKIMRSKGYTEELWQTRYFPGEGHDEDAWKKRFGDALLFLMNTKETLPKNQ